MCPACGLREQCHYAGDIYCTPCRATKDGLEELIRIGIAHHKIRPAHMEMWTFDLVRHYA